MAGEVPLTDSVKESLVATGALSFSWLAPDVAGGQVLLDLVRFKLATSAGLWAGDAAEGAEEKAGIGEASLSVTSSGLAGGGRGGGGGHSSVSRGDIGVGGPEGRLWVKKLACWADSARARASMRAAFFGGGGGGRRDTELTGAGACEESIATAPGEGQNRKDHKLGIRHGKVS